jgi:PAS domain S-box-containing protein
MSPELIGVTFMLAASIFAKGGAAYTAIKIAHNSRTCRTGWLLVAIAVVLTLIRSVFSACDIIDEPFTFRHSVVPSFLHLLIGILFWYSLNLLYKCYTNELDAMTSMAEEMPNRVVILEPDGECCYVNYQWTAYTGLNRDASRGLLWRNAILPIDKESHESAFSMARVSDINYEQKIRIIDKYGSPRWHLARAVPVRDVNCKVVLWFCTLTDIHDYILDKESIYGR